MVGYIDFKLIYRRRFVEHDFSVCRYLVCRSWNALAWCELLPGTSV